MKTLLRSLIALAMVAAAPAARAGGFSTTNVQLLQGYTFDSIIDTNFAGEFDDGTKTTLTINHFSTWEYGDSFFFTDLSRGRIGSEDLTAAYVEWHPRLFVNALLGQKEPLFGVIRNWGLATELNQGSGFHAYLAGLGLDFNVPRGYVLGLNLFYRYADVVGSPVDRNNNWQISPYWTVPFGVGPAKFVFTGFIDVNSIGNTASDEDGIEVWAQPQLLVDVGAFAGRAGKFLAGVEWAYHSQDLGDFEESSSAPQIMVQWTIF